MLCPKIYNKEFNSFGRQPNKNNDLYKNKFI